MLRRYLSDIAGLVGVALVAAGLGLFHPALALIAVGLGCVVYAVRS